LFDVARAFNKRVPMSRLVEIEPDLRPYLASVIIAALQKAREGITVPLDMPVHRVSQDDFDARLMQLATQQYPTYGILEQLGPKQVSPDEQRVQREQIRDNQLAHLLKDVGGLA
jgi:hypothetical protein